MKRVYGLLKMIADNGGRVKYCDISKHYKNTRSAQRVIATLTNKEIIIVKIFKPLFEERYKSVELTDYGYHVLKILNNLYT